MKPRIHLVIGYADGREVVCDIEGDAITEPVRHAVEDLLHTVTAGERPIVKNFYDLCAKAFGTTREDAKERLNAAAYGMEKHTFDERKRLA